MDWERLKRAFRGSLNPFNMAWSTAFAIYDSYSNGHVNPVEFLKSFAVMWAIDICVRYALNTDDDDDQDKKKKSGKVKHRKEWFWLKPASVAA